MWLRGGLVVALVILAGCSGNSRTTVVATEVPPGAGGNPLDTPVVDTLTPAPPEAPEALVLVAFDLQGAAVDDVVEAAVSVVEVDDLYGVEVHMTFDTEVLEVVDLDDSAEGIQVADGDLLKVGYVVQNQADNVAGTIDYAVSQMPPSTGVTGAGTIVRIQFRARAAGTAALQVNSLVLASSEGHAIPASPDPGVAELTIE